MAICNKGKQQGGSPDQPGRTVSSGFDAVESDIRRYRRRRERRPDIERRRVKQLSTQAREVEDILAFARLWAPFGGVPEDETFIKFGMRSSRFLEKLGHILSEMPCDNAEVDQLRKTYPPDSVAVTGPDSDVPTISDGHPRPGCTP